MKKAPCYKCEQRHSTCYSTCEKYKEFEAYKQIIYKERKEHFEKSFLLEVTKTANYIKKYTKRNGS